MRFLSMFNRIMKKEYQNDPYCQYFSERYSRCRLRCINICGLMDEHKAYIKCYLAHMLFCHMEQRYFNSFCPQRFPFIEIATGRWLQMAKNEVALEVVSNCETLKFVC
ncbi:hypothetical protein A4A49_23094 [Nicotiana attenuata]|uniref:Uncharacterized protein n=1 Tax=Nicotiana attenuata TaxID=49451 RepID=A0A314KZR2_NICAT|nr:hypothetical protein A4A49_23094 [Nicotiana attenuata]